MQIECFPEAPAEWPRKIFADVAAVNPTYRLNKTTNYPFIEMAAVAENFGGIVSLDHRKADASGLSRFKVGDILFGKITPCAENGKVALVKDLPAEFGLGSTEFIVLSPRSGNDRRFVYAMACATPVRGRAVSRMEGSTGRLRVTEDVFTKWLVVAAPPEPEQRAIADILDAADSAIERTCNAIEKARRMKKSLVQSLFTKGTGHTRFRSTVLGKIPDKWKVVSVGDLLVEAQYGLSMPMHQKGEYPILRMAAIQEGNVLLGNLKYVDLAERVAADYLLRRGDILFNRTNSADLVGKVGVYRSDRPAVFASYLIRMKTNPDLVDNYFLGQLLATYPVQCRIKRYATPGVQQVNINATNLQRVLVAVPVGVEGLKEQCAIADILERQDDCIRQLESRVDMLTRLKRGLMQDLLTGKRRVVRNPD